MERLHHREDFITIPVRGTTVNSFTHQLNSDSGIIIHVEVDDTSRKKYKLGDTRNKKRKFKIPYTRVDIGSHPDARSGVLIWDVAEDFTPNLAETLNFVNLYLGYNITVEEVNPNYFDSKNRILTIRIRKNSLRYTGQIRVTLI